MVLGVVLYGDLKLGGGLADGYVNEFGYLILGISKDGLLEGGFLVEIMFFIDGLPKDDLGDCVCENMESLLRDVMFEDP